MRATMMDTPLTITALMRYGTTAYGDNEVITATSPEAGDAGGGMRRRTYHEIGSRVARLAGALRSLGVTGDQRVATLMWNNAEHLEAYLAWDRIEDRGALDGYVRRAMVNTHISWWRRRRVQEFPTDELPDQAVADHAGDSDLQETLRRAIDRLPHRMRAAVVLRYYEDMTEAEVAERLGVSLGTVKSTVSRAVAKLRIDAELLAD